MLKDRARCPPNLPRAGAALREESALLSFLPSRTSIRGGVTVLIGVLLNE